jgi:hypothetical protein
MTQVVGYLPSKHKALSSNPSTAEKKEREKEKTRVGKVQMSLI